MQKYFCSRLTQIKSITRAVPPHRGADRDRHGRGAGCGGRGSVGRVRDRRAGRKTRERSNGVLTNDADADGKAVWSWHPLLVSSWRRRVGLTGLRRSISADDGDKTNSSPGRARNKPLKPLRAGMPGDSGGPSVTTLVCLFHFCTRGCGCIGHPAFPTPSIGRMIPANLGRIAPRECEVVFELFWLFEN